MNSRQQSFRQSMSQQQALYSAKPTNFPVPPPPPKEEPKVEEQPVVEVKPEPVIAEQPKVEVVEQPKVETKPTTNNTNRLPSLGK